MSRAERRRQNLELIRLIHAGKQTIKPWNDRVIVWNKDIVGNYIFTDKLVSPEKSYVIPEADMEPFEQRMGGKHMLLTVAEGCKVNKYETANATYLAGKPEAITKPLSKRIKDRISRILGTSTEAKETPAIAPQQYAEKLTTKESCFESYDENLLRSPISKPGEQFTFSIGDKYGEIRNRLMQDLNRQL